MLSVIASVNKKDVYEKFLLPSLERAQRSLREIGMPELDIVVVEGSESIFKNYNAGAAKAIYKIKVFVHQDVDLMEPTWVFKILKTFAEDPKCGLIGMVGTTVLNDRGFWWESGKQNVVGELFSGNEKADWSFKPLLFPVEVQCVDGFFMALRADVWWDETLTGFHCYDMDMSRTVRSLDSTVKVIPHKAWHVGEIRSNEGVDELLRTYAWKWRDRR